MKTKGGDSWKKEEKQAKTVKKLIEEAEDSYVKQERPLWKEVTFYNFLCYG